MKETENKPSGMYEAGRDFYGRKMEELHVQLFESTDPFEQLNVLEELELSNLKLLQLKRREQVLEQGIPLETMIGGLKEVLNHG